MDITTLPAWGELLGGIGVIVSLVYLAGQIRQNSRLLRAESRRAVDHQARAMVNQIGADAEIARIMRLGLGDPQELNSEDKYRFRYLFAGFVANIETYWREAQYGTAQE